MGLESNKDDKSTDLKETVETLVQVDSIQTTNVIRDPMTGQIASIEYNSTTNPGFYKATNFFVEDNGFLTMDKELLICKSSNILNLVAEQGNRTVRFEGDYKISKLLPVIDKHLDIAPNGYCIKTYDDKKEKECSCEAELIFEIDSIGSNASGYGNIDTRIIGYGKNKKEALDDLDKIYLHTLNKFLIINKY